MQELLRNATAGWQRYTDQGKFAVLFLAVLLAVFYLKAVQNKKWDRETQIMLLYASVTGFLVVFPVTAVLLMVYQTRFYDYEWVFSMVPVTAVIAFGGTWFLLKYSRSTKGKWWKTTVVSAILLIIVFLCGNLGRKDAWNQTEFLNSGHAAVENEKAVQMILDKLEEEGDTQNICMWAPRQILSGVRGVNGSITLLYGRNMWEKPLNAYSYDVYGEDIVTMYEWMETLARETGNLDETDSSKEERTSVFERAVECNVNCILVPENTAQYLEEDLRQVARKEGLQVSGVSVEGYYMYRLWP